jgi:predicted Zn-dependent peptidase
LVYGISSFSSSYTDTGVFGIYAGTGEKQIEELIPVLCDELKNSPNSISEKEIKRGKAQLKAGLMMGRESAFRRCESAARQLLIFNRVIDPLEIINQIDAVSKETVEKIAKQIVAGPITISSIGPIKKLETLDKIQDRLN